MKRVKHNLSNYHLTTGSMGKLIPVQCLEVLPGDTMRLETSAFIRMSPMLAPIMHPITVRIHHWFVPTRLLWDKWEEFITDPASGHEIPTVTINEHNFEKARILSYLGAEPQVGMEYSLLPVRAYNMIFNNFYVDQDIDVVSQLDHLDIRRVSFSKDNFTTARPWRQKGPDITLPIGKSAPVKADHSTLFNFLRDHDAPGTPHSHLIAGEDGRVDVRHADNTRPDSGNRLIPHLHADLSKTTGVTATDFRAFFALQRFAEARAMYGSRYTDYLRYLGVKPSDARLQTPEYLGGGKSQLNISEVLQTAQDGDTPVGTLRGHGAGAVRSRPAKRFFEEHGFVMTMISVLPKSIYVDGTPRVFLKRHHEDFFQRELQSIGQQPVFLGEVYHKKDHDPYKVFGYQDRYSEYTWHPSRVSGDFRHTLDYWHMGRKFTEEPHLNRYFIRAFGPGRVFADRTAPQLQMLLNNKVVARRLVKRKAVGRLM